jgi:hypothetical protein
MPTIMALAVSSLAGWGVDQALGGLLGGASLVVNLVLSSILFYVVRKKLVDLRDG